MDNYPFQNKNGWVKPGSAVPTVPNKENLSQSMTNQSIANQPIINLSIAHPPAGNGTILEATKIAPASSQKNNQTSSANKSISTIKASPSNQTKKDSLPIANNSVASGAENQPPETKPKVYKI